MNGSETRRRRALSELHVRWRRVGMPLRVIAVALAVFLVAIQARSAERVALSAEVERLRESVGDGAAITVKPATGAVSFIRFDERQARHQFSGPSSGHERTMAFLAEHGGAFGLENARVELQLLSETTDQFGFSHARYRQIYRGVPVFGSDLRSHFDRDGRLFSISATTMPVAGLDAVATITAERASRIAETVVAWTMERREPVSDLENLRTELVVFRTGLVRGVAGRNHLAYWIEVVDDRRSVREFVFVDAHTGKILDRYTGIHDGVDRKIYAGGIEPEYLVWQEGDPLPFSGDDEEAINALIDFAEDGYNLFLTMSGGGYPSFDGADATMSSVFDDPALYCDLLGANAWWNGDWTGFCDGTTADDVVAHEWTHAYTEYTHGLIYQWQPGALNESYSDIFGEVVDRLNGAGTDAPDVARSFDGGECSSYDPAVSGTDDSLRWLIGEDAYAFGGAIRDMWRPECHVNPGRVSAPYYWCSEDDGGGVHTNSGVPNHAFALLVDGGTYNNHSVSAIGLTRAAHIYWYAMTTYQGPVTDFADHADALEASCATLIGENLPALSTDSSTTAPSGITIDAADCTELSEAIAAVELRSEPDQCGFEPILEHDPPALCAGLGAKQTISFTDWEVGLGGWTAGTRSITSPATFDTPDWAVVGGLPDARSGLAAFVENYQGGDCDTDVESGVLYLESPDIEIPPGTLVPRVAVNHWIATETYYDGGNIKMSVNGGAFALVPLSAFDIGPYNDTLAVITPMLDPSDNPLAGEDAFTGTDGGQPSGSWGASYVNLYGLAGAGDTIRLRFEFGVDGCGGVEGWYVDEVELYSCADELPPSDCGNGWLDEGEVCDDGNSVNEDGCSNTCQVEPGWSCTTPTAAGSINDPSFEAGTPNPYWDEASINLGTPLCNANDCFFDAADDGQWYAWFGGVLFGYEESSLGQSITIPEGNSTLRFFLWVNACDSPQDYLEVLLDGDQVWSVTGASPLCGRASGSYQDVDVSGYADGSSHDLSFHCETFSANLLYSNFYVDVVTLVGQQSVCTFASAGIFADGFESGDTTMWTASTLPPP